jgi:hypothetical protein
MAVRNQDRATPQALPELYTPAHRVSGFISHRPAWMAASVVQLQLAAGERLRTCQPGWRTAIWTAALAVMGGACIANASRCGRIHCYVTGPFLLLAALGTLLYGLGVIPLGANGWNVIGLTILIGAIVLCCLPELLFGKYRRS